MLPRIKMMTIIIISDHSNLTEGRTAATHGSFSHIRQVAQMWTVYPVHGSLGPRESFPSPNERHLDRFSRFCMLTGVPNTDGQITCSNGPRRCDALDAAIGRSRIFRWAWLWEPELAKRASVEGVWAYGRMKFERLSPGFGSRRGTKRHRNNLNHMHNNHMK